jgi:hypothetical protein
VAQIFYLLCLRDKKEWLSSFKIISFWCARVQELLGHTRRICVASAVKNRKMFELFSYPDG